MNSRKLRVYINLMPLYEDNYQRLMHLLPELGAFDSDVSYRLTQIDAGATVDMNILERGPYTTTFTLAHSLATKSHSIPNIFLTVRAYHDARLAEVIAYQDQSRFSPHYDYPNRQMRYPFEKRQINLFFREWLDYCRSCRRTVEGLTDCGRA